MPPRAYKRTILITGATDGLGKQLALELSSRPDENFLILHGRTKRKCEQTIEWLCHENKLSGFAANLDYIAADFSRMTETARMADEVKLRFPRLNTMVCCAAVVVQRKRTSDDGLEMMLQVNHLSHYILWTLLLPLLEANAPSRIITVGSVLHSINPIDWTDVQCEKHTYDKLLQYSRTKLMNDLATFYIHRLLFKHGKQFQVTANVVEADEKIERRATTGSTFNVFSASESHLNLIHKSNTVGLQTLVQLVEHPDYAGVSGKYFDANGKELRKIADLGQVRLQDQLWETSRSLCAHVLGSKPEVNNVDGLESHPGPSNGDEMGKAAGAETRDTIAKFTIHPNRSGHTKALVTGMTAFMSSMVELLAERVAKDAKRDLFNELEREYERVAVVIERNLGRFVPAGRLFAGCMVKFSATFCLRYKLDVFFSESSQLCFDVECRPRMRITLGPMERETSIDELAVTAHAFIRNDIEERLDAKFDEIAEEIRRKIDRREERERRIRGGTGTLAGIGRLVYDVRLSVVDNSVVECTGWP